MKHTPITAIVIFRNEAALLDGCLAALGWCDELIAIDMESSDGSLEVARRYADRVYHVKTFPIAEPTRVAAAKLARHDWVLLVDPDEHFQPELVKQIRQTLASKPEIGSLRLPWWYYFKGKRLDGTIWGGGRAFKRMLIHRQRCGLLPYCNRITEPIEGFEHETIQHDGHNHVHHYWSDSYWKLFQRHLTRYCHLEAAAQYAQGQKFRLGHALTHPLTELKRCLKDYDGWRIGPRGFLLSAIYFFYTLASDWLLLYYQWRNQPKEQLTTTQIPQLVDDSQHPQACLERQAA